MADRQSADSRFLRALCCPAPVDAVCLAIAPTMDR